MIDVSNIKKIHSCKSDIPNFDNIKAIGIIETNRQKQRNSVEASD